MKLKNLKIGTQLMLGFGAMLLFVVVLGTVTYRQSGQLYKQTETMYNHPVKTSRVLREIVSNFLIMRVNIRDYLVEEHPDDRRDILNKIAVNQTDVLSEIDKLREYYLGPHEDIDEMNREFVKWNSILQETIRMGSLGKLAEARQLNDLMGPGPKQATKVMAALQKVSDFAIKKGDELNTNAFNLSNSLNRQLILLVVLMLILSVVVYTILIRDISTPLVELTEATRRFREGDRDSRSSYTSQNELGLLSGSFNSLAESIQENMSLNEKVVSLASLMLSKYEAKEFFRETLNALTLHTNSQMAAIYLLSDDKKTFDHFESIGLDLNARISFDALSFEGEFGALLVSHKVQHIRDISGDTRFVFHTVSGMFIPHEIITIPVLSHQEVVAIISLASVSSYNQQAIQLIESILDTLNARIEGIIAYHKMLKFSEKLEIQSESLAKASHYNRGLIEASIDALVTIGPNGSITDVNTSTETLTGRKRGELIGTDFTNYFTDPMQAKAGYQQVFRDGFVRDYELVIRHTSGKETPVLYNASVYHDEAGKVIGIFAAARDITERKNTEQEMLRLNNELIQRSEKLSLANSELEAQKSELSAQSAVLMGQNIELEIQKRQLHEASRLKTNFLSNMSHELRTPLNSVIALSGVLSRRLLKKIPEEEYGYLEVIERNGKHLLTLINDILDISRIEAGHEEIDLSEFNTNDLIADVISMIKPVAQQKNIELLFPNSGSGLLMTSDVDKCRHILLNLIGNAVKFTEKGKVEISAVQSDTNIEIAVSDTGIGISEKNLPHIFNEFRQADGSTSRMFGGTGLGLAIAKKYANLLGGTISVKSTPGKGSEFKLSLPLLYAAENRVTEGVILTRFNPENRPMQRKLISGSTNKTILLVDDNEAAILEVKDILMDSGYKLLFANNGKEALEIITQSYPDGIILDLLMPGMDGFEVLRIIREVERTSHIPVLVLTAKHITKEELKFLKQNNVHQLIQKGLVNSNELVFAVDSMIFPEINEAKGSSDELHPIMGIPLVLVVEDNPDNMTTVKAILAGNYTVIEASDGIEAVEMARKHKPDLILMDIDLPKRNGIAAFKIIRKDAALQHIPVIALTASAMTADRETILAQGMAAYIPKPIEEKTFFKTINSVLYGK